MCLLWFFFWGGLFFLLCFVLFWSIFIYLVNVTFLDGNLLSTEREERVWVWVGREVWRIWGMGN